MHMKLHWSCWLSWNCTWDGEPSLCGPSAFLSQQKSTEEVVRITASLQVWQGIREHFIEYDLWPPVPRTGIGHQHSFFEQQINDAIKNFIRLLQILEL